MDIEDPMNVAYILIFLAVVMCVGLFYCAPKQDKTAQLNAKYMMDDYGNIYSIQPCQNCKNCIQLQQIDTAEIKVKAFDFVPR